MVKKTKYAAGIEIESAFGRTDYMYVYEVAPWAYDAINDWIKVAIESAIPFDLSDDWTRQLGQIDLFRYAGVACGLLNPVHVGITVAGAIVDPRSIRALTAADIVSAAQSGVWSVGRTWALAIATDAVAAQVSNWPALYAANLTQYVSAACGLLNPIHVGITVAGAIVDPRQIRALVNTDIVSAEITKIGGTTQTGFDLKTELQAKGFSGDKIFAVNSAILTRKINLNAILGANWLNGDTVPAGEIWVITGVQGMNNTTAQVRIDVCATDDTAFLTLVRAANPAAGYPCFGQCNVVLGAGSRVAAWFSNCAAGDDLYLDYAGYKMKIA